MIQWRQRRLLKAIRTSNTPSELEARIAEWVYYYNIRRVHESLGNVTPDDKHFGRSYEIMRRRLKIKERTMRKRRRDYLMSA